MILSKGEGGCSSRAALGLPDDDFSFDETALSAGTIAVPADDADWVQFDEQRRRLDVVFGIKDTAGVSRPRNWNCHKLNYEYVTTQAGLKEVVDAMNHPGVTAVALDIETTGLKPWMSSVRLVQIAVEIPEPRQFVIDCWAVDPSEALAILERPEIETIGCNASFEQVHLGYHFGIVIGNLFDISYSSAIANKARGFSSHWADGKRKITHNYRTMMRRFTGKRISKESQVSDWAAEDLSAKQKRYAAMDVAGALDIAYGLKKLMHEVPALVDKKTGEVTEVPVAIARKNRATILSCLDQLEVASDASYDAIRIARAIEHTRTAADCAAIERLILQASMPVTDRRNLTRRCKERGAALAAETEKAVAA